MIHALLIRMSDNGKQTEGVLHVFDNGKLVGSFNTLELPWKKNKQWISCIPKGTYPVTYRKAEESRNFDYDHFHVQNVPGRTWILIHIANFIRQLLGCIAIGKYGQRWDIDGDGLRDIAHSTRGLNELRELAPKGFLLHVV